MDTGRWEPAIDWQRFNRGPISEQMWGDFTQLVRICHAYHHWQRETARVSMTRPPRPLHSESKYMARKGRREIRKRG
jgi:hypothetical protein